MFNRWTYVEPQETPVKLNGYYHTEVRGLPFLLTVNGTSGDYQATIRDKNDPMGNFFHKEDFNSSKDLQGVLAEVQAWAAPILANEIKHRLYKSRVEIPL